MKFRCRKNLPHLESQSATYFVTFRLADSVPKPQIDDWKFEREGIRRNAEQQGRALSVYEKQRLKYLFSKKNRKLSESWSRRMLVKESSNCSSCC
jgi:hypothetical protein